MPFSLFINSEIFSSAFHLYKLFLSEGNSKTTFLTIAYSVRYFNPFVIISLSPHKLRGSRAHPEPSGQ
jgi:hypothetical protein